jgi:hypothetical protein
MYKIKDITKKTLKQTMVISAIVTMLLVSLGSLSAMKSYALSLSGLMPSFGSSDNNNRSIDTDNFLSCLGVGTECTNVNVEDNSTTP